MSSTLRSWLLFARLTSLRTEANTRSFASWLSSRNVGESNTRRSATKSHNNALQVFRLPPGRIGNLSELDKIGERTAAGCMGENYRHSMTDVNQTRGCGGGFKRALT